MGRDKAKKHYQAPTSTADSTLQVNRSTASVFGLSHSFLKVPHYLGFDLNALKHTANNGKYIVDNNMYIYFGL